MDLLPYAQWYLALGLDVIALSGKLPNTRVHPHGIKDSFSLETADWPAVERAFHHRETTGIGAHVAYPKLVVDIDSTEGAENWKALVGDDYLPTRWVAKTAHGLHMWFADPVPTGSFVLRTKLDIKSEGGYVAMPPSLHPEGTRYEWLLPPDGEALDMPPDKLHDVILGRYTAAQRMVVTRETRRPVQHPFMEGGRLWASVGYEHLVEAVANAQEGNRNNLLAWAVMTARDEGMPYQEARAQFYEAGKRAGLGSHETVATIRSAYRGKHD